MHVLPKSKKTIISSLEQFPPLNTCRTSSSKKEQLPRKLYEEIRYLFLTPNLYPVAYLMRIDNPNLVGKMFEYVYQDSVRSDSTCLANLGVWSCLVSKLICPVWLSPSPHSQKQFKPVQQSKQQGLRAYCLNTYILCQHSTNCK